MIIALTAFSTQCEYATDGCSYTTATWQSLYSPDGLQKVFYREKERKRERLEETERVKREREWEEGEEKEREGMGEREIERERKRVWECMLWGVSGIFIETQGCVLQVWCF